MDELLAELVGALLEIVGEFLLQMLFELAAELLSGLLTRERESRPAVSAMGLASFGAVAGLLSAWVFPHRLIGTRVALPGASLLLAALATGSAMHLVGKRQRQLGRYSSELATFRGGAIFAFSMALGRWWLVGVPH